MGGWFDKVKRGDYKESMIKVAIVGASGYAGCELVRLLSKHQNVTLTHLYVSQNSEDANEEICALNGMLSGLCCLKLEPLSYEHAATLTNEDADVIFMATDHKVSHDLAPIFLDNGIVVIDLSGAFRISDLDAFSQYYGFEFGDKQRSLMQERVYGLVDFVKAEDLQRARLISMPGCYPTASELALKPLAEQNLLDTTMAPVINAVSGVSGAGRKAKLTNSFCEVSLNAYGIFNHRHLIEIEEYVGTKVIFNPHLGDFKRGILATITARLKKGVTTEQVNRAYANAYPKCALSAKHEKDHVATESLPTLVRVKSGTVKLQDVQNTPFCDLSFKLEPEQRQKLGSDNNEAQFGPYIVISSAIDNLLKGAASQAVEAMNIHFGLPRSRSLL